MKRKILFVICTLLSMGTLLLSSCEDETPTPTSQMTSSITFNWSSALQGDTVMLLCQQSVLYKDQSGSHIVYPKTVLKLWPKYPKITYTNGLNPTPVFKQSKNSITYDGVMPRKKINTQEISFTDTQVYIAEMSMEMYVYNVNNQEIALPYVEIQNLRIDSIPVISDTDLANAIVYFNLPWMTNDGSQTGVKNVKSTYVKQKVSENDKLLQTTFSKGIDWKDASSFELYVEKTEVWQISGTKKERLKSPLLIFNLSGDGTNSVEVSNFEFTSRLSSLQGQATDLSQNNWNIKCKQISQSLRFNNGYEDFDVLFTYPLYEVSTDWEGQNFYFDLSVQFDNSSKLTKNSETTAENLTTGSALLNGHRFEKTVQTSLKKKQQDDSGQQPITGSKYGKVIDFFVSAVFDPAFFETGSNTSMTKKCVVVHYEKGYDWGICEYETDFPTEYHFTESTYSSFNSAAKSKNSSAFELARVQESNTNLLWYSADYRLISGIDALTCKIYDWKCYKDGAYVSLIKDYSAKYNNDSYSITIFAPSGKSVTFNSSP